MGPGTPGRRLASGTARAVLGIVALLGPVAAEACATCIGGGGEGAGLNPGFYWSAVVLTALPFVAMVVAGAWLHRQLSATGRHRVPGPTVRGAGAGAADRPGVGARPPAGGRTP
jgi:hypothetical protein